jgi:hypothetical protein
MGVNRFNFADDEAENAPRTQVWVTRAIIVSAFVGGAAAVHILMNWNFRWHFW